MVVIDEVALRQLLAGEAVILEAADQTEVRVVFSDIG